MGQNWIALAHDTGLGQFFLAYQPAPVRVDFCLPQRISAQAPPVDKHGLPVAHLLDVQRHLAMAVMKGWQRP
jgi:hypothetical protein